VVLPTPPFWLAIEMTRAIPLSAGADFLPTDEEVFARGLLQLDGTISVRRRGGQEDCFT